jgi:hypothetical protein
MARASERKEALLFLKKKKQKNFYPLAPITSGVTMSPPRLGANKQEFFGSFFQKRTVSLS